MKRGILGVKRDPKKPMLLFSAGDPWPSDNSSDSDYEVPSNKKSKSKNRSKASNKGQRSEKQLVSGLEQSVKGKLVLKCRKVRVSDEAAGNSPNNKTRRIQWECDDGSKPMTNSDHLEKGVNATSKSCIVDHWGTALPIEIVVRIFQFVVRSEGVLPFLQRASRVCKLWALAVCDPSLWTRTDLSLSKVNISENKLESLCQKHLKMTKEIALNGWGAKLTLRGIEAVLSSCTNLTSVNFSGCTNITATIMKRVVDSYPNLTSIDLSYMAPSSSSENPLNSNSIKYIVAKCGTKLTYFNLAENICAVPAIINSLADACPKLKVLDMSNIMIKDRSTFTINIEKLQRGWSELKVLRLTNVSCRLANTTLAEQAASPGFPQLEELSIARITNEYYQGLDDNALIRILKTSHRLKLLDVRGCARITASGLIRFPTFDLEYLFLSQCPAAMTADLELVMEKWCHSLVEVDLSWNNISGEAVDQAVKSLASSSKKSILHTLNLSGSAVSYEPVKSILSNCSKLSILNLTSCRGLPRGIKRMYMNRELQAFREDINALNEDDVNDT